MLVRIPTVWTSLFVLNCSA